MVYNHAKWKTRPERNTVNLMSSEVLRQIQIYYDKLTTA